MAANTTITTTALIMKKAVAALAIVIIKKKVVATGITSNIGVARGNLTRVVSGFGFKIYHSNRTHSNRPIKSIQATALQHSKY
ncbi:hypothetical protein [Helicobacter pylori]|uniref:hypothetical protein n=1 Tax=Helicobacter pylori TaxID=210 RepID=UPI001E5C1F9D|nr:hypothetical protein [Helicobacter pylori]